MCLCKCNADWTASYFHRVKAVRLEYSFLYWHYGVVCGDRFCLFFVLLIQLMFVSATGAILVCFPVISHPRGTLASRSRAAQTANVVIQVRAPTLTSRAAPVWTGVRSCGLIAVHCIPPQSLRMRCKRRVPNPGKMVSCGSAYS
jgi:hypothetical protein